MKKIHIFLALVFLFSFLPPVSLAEVGTLEIIPMDKGIVEVPKIANLMDGQWEQERVTLEEYGKGNYTLEKPYIVENPYGFAPLTGLLLFETAELATVSLEIKGNQGGETIKHTFETLNTVHQIPVVGLYPDQVNLVEVTVSYEEGGSDTVTVELETPVVETLGRSVFYDESGDLRWVLDYSQDYPLTRLDNGNLLVVKENRDGFYEMDLLGKVLGEYHTVNLIEDSIVELPNGNFLLCSDHEYSRQDRLMELDRETGQVLLDLDLREIFKAQVDPNGLTGDWYHLDDMVFDSANSSVILHSHSHGTSELAYPSGAILGAYEEKISSEEVTDLYPTVWEFGLLTRKGKVMAKNGEELTQTWVDYEILESFSYDAVMEGEFFFYRNENTQSLEVIGAFSEKTWLILEGKETYRLSLETGEVLSLDYENISENVEEGEYSLGILMETAEERLYYPTEYTYIVTEQRKYLEMADILVLQEEIAKELDSAFQAEVYTMAEPMIVLNPYGNTPLSALVAFETEESGTMEVTLQGQVDEDLVQKFSSITNKHFLPIYGLYPGSTNVVTLQFTDEKGQRNSTIITIEVPPLSNLVRQAEVEIPRETEGEMTFVSGQGLTAYDGWGNVRWYCDLVTDSPILRLQNGNLLIHSNKSYRDGYSVTGFYEIDLLGRVYREYVVNGTHHEIQELSNGDFFVGAEINDPQTSHINKVASTTARDYLLIMDRETGEIKEEWDLKEVLNLEEYQADQPYWDSFYAGFSEIFSEEDATAWSNAMSRYDWFLNNAIYYDEKRDCITVSGKHQDLVFQFDADTMEITWAMSDDASAWTDATLEGAVEPFAGQSNFRYMSDGTLMILDNGQHRDNTYQVEATTGARIVGYDIDPDLMMVEEVFTYEYLPASGMGDIRELGKNHYLFQFSEVYSDESHVVEWKEGEEVFLMTMEGESDYTQRMSLYPELGSYHNLNYQSTRVGYSNLTAFVKEAMPLATDDLDYTVTLAIDQGDRIGVQISFHSHGEEEKYLVLDSGEETRRYAMESEEVLYINKGGIPTGEYEIGVYVKNEEGDGLYTTSGYYVSIPETEVFLPLATEEAFLPIEIYGTTEMVGGALIGFIFFIMAHQVWQRAKEK